jgi:peptidoglycan/xylan/chitin deacetylase (PgdA/CDA1 family)
MSMVRRRTVALVLAVLVVLAGCTASVCAAWRAPAASAGTTSILTRGDGARSATPPARAKPAALASPSPSPIPLPPLLGPGGLRGPDGSMYRTGSSAVALTFDDGPGRYTGQILDVLKRYGIHATFCIIGTQVAAQASLIRRIVREGHTLCNHTWSHDEKLRTRTPAQIASELRRTDDAIHAIVPGARIAYFRNPGGNFSPQTVAIAASMGMRSLYWSVDPDDWTVPGTQTIINNVMSHTRSGSIVLMHDGGGDRAETVAALKTLLPTLKNRYKLVALPTSATSSG